MISLILVALLPTLNSLPQRTRTRNPRSQATNASQATCTKACSFSYQYFNGSKYRIARLVAGKTDWKTSSEMTINAQPQTLLKLGKSTPFPFKLDHGSFKSLVRTSSAAVGHPRSVFCSPSEPLGASGIGKPPMARDADGSFGLLPACRTMPRKASSRKVESKMANSRGSGSGIAPSIPRWMPRSRTTTLRYCADPFSHSYARISLGLAQRYASIRLMRCAEKGFHWLIQRRCIEATITREFPGTNGRRKRRGDVRRYDVRSRTVFLSLLALLEPGDPRCIIGGPWRRTAVRVTEYSLQRVVLEIKVVLCLFPDLHCTCINQGVLAQMAQSCSSVYVSEALPRRLAINRQAKTALSHGI